MVFYAGDRLTGLPSPLRVILPLGDSITEAVFGGYRVQLFSRSLSGGKNITFVGSGSNGPDTVGGYPFPKAHEGHNGYSIAQVGELSDPWVSFGPDIVLLHIGTNDVIFNPTGAVDRLETLLDELIADAPATLLVVARLIPMPDYAALLTTYNAGLVTAVNERIASGARMLLVDMFTDFPADGLEGDDIHPNETGHAWMGDQWYEAIEGYL